MIRRTLLLLFTLLGYSVPARAQGQYVAVAWVGLSGAAIVHLLEHRCCGQANIGSTVRFRDDRAGGRDIIGVVRALDLDSMTVAVGDSATWRGPLAGVHGLRVRATESKWAQGWLIGLVAGATLGGVLGATIPTEPNDDFYFGRPVLVVIGAAGGGFLGSTLGALVGAASTGEYWQPVPRGHLSAAIFVSPTNRRVGLRVSIR